MSRATRTHPIQRPRSPRLGLTLIETAIALALIAVLLSILLPALSSARLSSYRERCAAHLATIGEGWHLYLDDHARQFPFVPVQPGWQYGGARFSKVDGSAYPDYDRPLTQYLGLFKTREFDQLCVCCPADRGIVAAASAAGTSGRSAFESFGTSYRANAPMLDARLAGLPDTLRGMKRGEITSSPRKLVLCGDPVWHEVADNTGRNADWHGVPNSGNLLFLDGHVDFMAIKPDERSRPMLFNPVMPDMAVPLADPPAPTPEPQAIETRPK